MTRLIARNSLGLLRTGWFGIAWLKGVFMTRKRSIDIVKREHPDALVLDHADVDSDTIPGQMFQARQLSIKELRHARGDFSEVTNAVALNVGSTTELVKVRVGKTLNADRKPQTYTLVVSLEEDDIVGSQG